MAVEAACIEAHIPGLRRFARALLPGAQDLADDLVQDCLARVLSRWHMRRCDRDLRGWLYTILYDRILGEQHRQKRRGIRATLTQAVEADRPPVTGGQGEALAHRDLVRSFAALPDDQQAAMLLVGVEDLSYEEAAKVLGVPIGTVMSHLSRGREGLRQFLNRATDAQMPRGIS
jgi:RNA polymerase sigma-70 factor, ECF subfamily